MIKLFRDIAYSSWVRVPDKSIFSQCVTGRPSDEGARPARNEQGEDSLSRTRRLEELYIFEFEVFILYLNDDFFICKHASTKIEIFLHCTLNGKLTSNT